MPETITADAVPTGLVLRTFAVKEPPPAPPLRVGTLEYQMIERALHVQKKGEGEEKEGEEGKFSTLKEPAFQIKQIVRHHKRRRWR